MSFVITVKSKEYKIKFNYMLNFKANKKLGSKNKEGQSQNDGAGLLFSKVLDKDDDGIIDLVQLVADKKVSDDDVLEGISTYIEQVQESGKSEEEAYDQIFTDLKEEMLQSGFFLSKIKHYIENMETAVKMLSAKEDEESQANATVLKEMIEKMKNEISSSTVQDKD